MYDKIVSDAREHLKDKLRELRKTVDEVMSKLKNQRLRKHGQVEDEDELPWVPNDETEFDMEHSDP